MTQEALRMALDALEDLLDQTESPPDKNCSCHIAPPCSDCVDYSGVRYAIEQANKTITAIKEALAQPQRTWQGLTNNDLQPIAEEYRILFGSWVHDFARAIEAKLKEKNT